MKTRALRGDDEALLWRFLSLRSGLSLEKLMAHSVWSHYAKSWGRDGDFSLCALKLRDGEHQSVGLVWSRLYAVEASGFGFVAPDIPEMMLAVESASDLKRVRGQLLDRHLSSLRHRFNFVSTFASSDDVNAIRLYQSAGFYAVEGLASEVTKLLLNLQR